MNALAQLLERCTSIVGRSIAWLGLALVVTQFIVVLLRYGFDLNAIAAQESITYMHALVFLLAAAWTMQREGHVRVDIFYGRFSPRRKAWVDVLGAIFLLLPTCGFIFYISWEYVAEAWRIRESSRESGGLPWVWLLKTAIPLMAVLLALQGIAQILKNLSALLSNTEQQTS